ncbi:MAG: hypothetical protein R3A44_17760 [Caldilineaceae bacterium]
MLSTYRLHTDELDLRFIEALKKLFQDKTIEIVVTEVFDDEIDETEYLFASAANRARLLQAVDNVNNNNHLTAVDIESLE